VISGNAIHTLGGRGDATEEIASPYDEADLHAGASYFRHLMRERRDPISVESERVCTRKGFTADLQQDSLESWHALF
jgi:hypothetical protein